MINNDSERIFQDSNFLADSDFTYLFDFSERDGEQSGMNVFFGGNVTETFAPVINAGTGFCEPSTGHDMFDGWQKSGDCLAMQTTFDISSATTSTSHSMASQLNACSPGQYSKPLFQHVQAASGTPENKRRKIDDDSLHREASDSFSTLRHPLHKNHPTKHSRKILDETESEERGTPEKQSSSDLHKMLSTYPADGSSSASRRLPSPVSTSIHGSMQQLESISVYALKCLTKYGFCALDNFMGQEAGSRALSEVMKIESQGLFEDGRLVTQERNSQSVRGDKIFWIDSDTYPAISRLISRMDLIVFKLQKSFPERSISSRTKVGTLARVFNCFLSCFLLGIIVNFVVMDLKRIEIINLWLIYF